MDSDNIKNYGVRTLIEWYVTNLGSNVDEARQNPTIMNIQKEIERKLRDYDEDTVKSSRKRKNIFLEEDEEDVKIPGRKKRGDKIVLS